jgi:ribosomal-protein-alanine N-acetyltransferase
VSSRDAPVTVQGYICAMHFELETERLVLRLWTGDDAQALWELNEDPEVLKYTGDTNFESVEAMREFLLQYAQYRNYKMGRLVVVLKATGELLGWCGLKYHEEEGYVDLGYRLFKKFWNFGYATEASRVCLDYGFNELGLERVVARADMENAASIRVMQKLGFRFYEKGIEEGRDSVVYEMHKVDWQRSGQGG